MVNRYWLDLCIKDCRDRQWAENAGMELDGIAARLAEAERLLRRLRFLRVECITHKDHELMDDWREFLRPADSADEVQP